MLVWVWSDGFEANGGKDAFSEEKKQKTFDSAVARWMQYPPCTPSPDAMALS